MQSVFDAVSVVAVVAPRWTTMRSPWATERLGIVASTVLLAMSCSTVMPWMLPGVSASSSMRSRLPVTFGFTSLSWSVAIVLKLGNDAWFAFASMPLPRRSCSVASTVTLYVVFVACVLVVTLTWFDDASAAADAVRPLSNVNCEPSLASDEAARCRDRT